MTKGKDTAPGEYDLAVIGSGPGGMRAAVQAAKIGKTVIVVDRNGPGGGCAFFGTVPSKSLREAALHPGRRDNFRSSLKRMQQVIQEESRVILHQLERNGIRFLRGSARFVGPHSLEISAGEHKVHAKHFVIATGTSPRRPPEFHSGLGGPVYDSDSILGLKSLPKRLLVLGAGVIGCEYASIFAELGAKVTLADRRMELLRGVDHEAVAALQARFESAGISIALGSELGALQAAKTKGSSAKLEIKIGNQTWTGEAALVCLGRQANTASLGLESIGVLLDDRGQIKVDPETYQTNLPHICAVGDVIGPPALAAASAEQGRIASSRLFGLETEGFPASFPSGIYTIPEISSVGRLEPELKEKSIPYVVGRAFYRELARGLIMGENEGFVKLLVHKDTRRILGVHAFGTGASELIHIGQVAQALEAPVEFLVGNVFNYPTFAEAYKVAALNALNQLRNQ